MHGVDIERAAIVAEGCEAEKPPERRVAFPKLDAQAIFAPLPELPYQCRDLDICSGAPILVAGYGFSGKTIALQQMAIDMTQGAAIWGKFPSKVGRVLHIDYEQGARLTRERYQRLARGALLGPSDLQDRLALTSMPLVYLDSRHAEEHLIHELAGYQLCIIDSLRAAAPSVDENSSEVRRVLDRIGRASEATGCATAIIHHARKPQKDAPGGAKMAIRGSGAIYDACSSVLVFEAAKGQPTSVSHQKARNTGILTDDFVLTVSDVEGGGLAVSATSAPQAHSGGAALDHLKARIREYMTTHGDVPGKGALRERLECGRDQLFAAVSEMEMAGEIVDVGTHPRRPILHLAGAKS